MLDVADIVSGAESRAPGELRLNSAETQNIGCTNSSLPVFILRRFDVGPAHADSSWFA